MALVDPSNCGEQLEGFGNTRQDVLRISLGTQNFIVQRGFARALSQMGWRFLKPRSRGLKMLDSAGAFIALYCKMLIKQWAL